MSYIKHKVRVLYEQLRAQSRQICGDPGKIEYVLAEEYKKGHQPPQSGWQELTPLTSLHGQDAHYWIRASFTTPAIEDCEYLVLEALTGREGTWDAINPQGLVYLNGKMVQGLDANHTEVYLEPETRYDFVNYFYMSLEDVTLHYRMNLCKIDKRLEKLYYDLVVPYQTCLILDEKSDEYIRLMDVLVQTANLVDMREVYSEAYYASVAEATVFLERELYQKLCSREGKPVINYIGHTHIDVEWLWDRAQTREKVQRSFATAFSLMKKYPEFKFMLSQPELYRYLKEEAPEKYEELKKLVAEGRWEPEGSMWVEADCNLISGESLIRQILQGKKFFKEEFNKDCRVLFLPDVFGYSAAMPQVLKKSGIDFFVTSKISWNEFNQMPVDNFLWQGMDGTEIFTSFITAQDYISAEPQRFATYNGTITSKMNKGTWNRFQQKEYADRALATFGFGDGGGGATKDMLEHFRRLEKGLPGQPVAEMGFLVPHLEKIKQQFDEGCRRTRRTPRWVGELYLEYHRGTYTSIARNKRNNRKSEFLLQKAEVLSYTDLHQGGHYDADGLDKTWNCVLHDQFHDILPGTSIFEVYEGTDRDYARVAAYCGDVIQKKMEALAADVVSDGGLFVYNSLGFPRRGMISWDGRIVEVGETIPAFGWKVIPMPDIENKVEVDGLTITNPHYKITLDKSGRILSLFDREAEREVMRAGTCGNEFQAFEDYPRDYDNWEIADYYKEKMWLVDGPAEIEAMYDGCRAGLHVTKTYLKSRITQKIWLYSESRRIDFETEIDWKETHQILKVAFPLDVHAHSATYDVQFGHVIRPTHENTSWDKARFEVCAHKWVDVSENGYGISLLNDCKYGFNVEGSTLKMTVLKNGTYPNAHGDDRMHFFTYSLVPHTGDFRQAGIVQEAYGFNQSLECTAVPARQEGNRTAVYSLVSCDRPNVIVETIKKAEKDEGMIVRMYEAFDSRCRAGVHVAEGFSKAYLCDMMENELEELPFENNKVEIPVANFEIITLKFI